MPQGEPGGKPINKVLPFCPRATAEGMAGPGSVVKHLVPNLETGERVLWIYGASCAGTSAVFICRRFLKPKGRDGRTEGSPQDNQGCEVWALPKRQGWVMYTSQSISIFSSMAERLLRVRKDAGSSPAKCNAKECTASGKKINLLFCEMNTHEGRKPTCEKVSSKCNSKRWQSLNPARKNVPKGNL